MSNNTEQDHKQNLQSARQNSKSWGVSDTAKNITDAATPVGAVSLLSQASIFDDMPFVVAFGAAIIKDLLDFAIIGSIPGLSFVFSLMCGILIFFMMLLSGNSGKRRSARKMVGTKKMMGQGLALALGTLIEGVGFGLNFFPFETATVFVIYFMVLSDRKKAAEEEAKERT